MTMKTLLLLLLITMNIIAGCGGQQSADKSKLQVAASFYPMAEFVQAVGGDKVQVTTLVPDGAEPHDWEPSPKDLTRLGRAQVFVYNMMEDVRHSAEEKIQKKADKYKYPQRVNQNIAIGIFKNELLELMLEENINLRIRKLKNLQIEIEKYTLPVRKSKSQKRQFNKANKYACNLKPSF